MALLVFISYLCIVPSTAIDIFTDGMQTNLQWSTVGSVLFPSSNSNCPSAPLNCAELQGLASITSGPISIANYENIKIAYDIKVHLIEVPETCSVLYSMDNAVSFQNVSVYDNSHEIVDTNNQMKNITNTNSADSIQIRIQMDGVQLNDQCLISNVKISGSISTQITSLPTTDVPTNVPTTLSPTTDSPTFSPISPPTTQMPSTNTPTKMPTNVPNTVPTISPTNVPSNLPTNSPTILPSNIPSNFPTNIPSNIPTDAPSNLPTISPTSLPTDVPSNLPTNMPSTNPTKAPVPGSVIVINDNPTYAPTIDRSGQEIETEAEIDQNTVTSDQYSAQQKNDTNTLLFIITVCAVIMCLICCITGLALIIMYRKRQKQKGTNMVPSHSTSQMTHTGENGQNLGLDTTYPNMTPNNMTPIGITPSGVTPLGITPIMNVMTRVTSHSGEVFTLGDDTGIGSNVSGQNITQGFIGGSLNSFANTSMAIDEDENDNDLLYEKGDVMTPDGSEFVTKGGDIETVLEDKHISGNSDCDIETLYNKPTRGATVGSL